MVTENDDLDHFAEAAVRTARAVVLQDEEDDYGLSNQDKWALSQSALEEVRNGGFYTDLDWTAAYDWEVGNRLLAHAFMAKLRYDVYVQLLKTARSDNEVNRLICLKEEARVAHLKLRDKYEAVSKGKHSWTHRWLN